MTVQPAIAAPLAAPSELDFSTGIAAAAHLILPDLELGGRIDATTLRQAMEAAFGGSAAAGPWDLKAAYDAR